MVDGLSLDDAKEANQEARNGNLRSNDAGITDDLRVDYDEHNPVEVSLSPEVLITFDHIANISINAYGNGDDLLQQEQNLQGAGPQGYGYDVELTLAQPQIVDGTYWIEDTDGDYPEHRIVGDPESDGNPYDVSESVVKEDGEIVGSEVDKLTELPGGNTFDCERRDFDADYITVSISSSRAMNILSALDTAGMWFHTKEGDVQEGLFETPPNFGTDIYDSDEDGYPRLAGYPELRSDMTGQQGAISCLFDEDGEVTTRSRIEMNVYMVTDDGLDVLIPLTPEDDAYAKPTYPRGGGLYWDHDGDENPDAGADTQPTNDGSMDELHDEMATDPADSAQQNRFDSRRSSSSDDDHGGDGDSDGDDTDTTVYEDLTDDGQEFVDNAVMVLGAKEYESTDEIEDFSERVEEARSKNDITASEDTLRTIIEDQHESDE